MTISKMQGHIYELFIIRGELFTNIVTCGTNIGTMPEPQPNREKEENSLSKVEINRYGQRERST